MGSGGPGPPSSPSGGRRARRGGQAARRGRGRGGETLTAALRRDKIVRMVDLAKNLNQLEGTSWGKAAYPSALVAKCHELREKPLKQFTIEDLRIMIGQNIGLKYLVTLALDRLEVNPLAEGDFYPGDLLKAVLTVEPKFWKHNEPLHMKAATVASRALELARNEDAVVRKSVEEALQHIKKSIKEA